jgi:3-dehydroquinate synthetase
MAAMQSDKKTRGGRVRFVLAPRIGHAASYDDVPEKTVLNILRYAPHFLVRPLDLIGKRDD